VPFLGLTTAARGRPAGVLPVLILLPALGVSVFASVVSGGLASTQRLASWQSTGAPIKVTSVVDLPPDVVERVRRVPGVDLVVPAQTGHAQIGYSGERAEVIAVDLAQWRRVLDGAPITVPAPAAPPGPPAPPGTPDAPDAPDAPAAGSGVPALVSSELRGRGEFEIAWYARLDIGTRGVIPSLPGFYQRGKFIVLPFETPRPSGVNTLLISGDADPAAVLKAVGQPRAQVTSQAGALRTITGDPLTATIHDILLITTLALAGYALVAVILTLVIGAADRARALSFLRTLGLSDRQARGLTVLEILPLVVVSSLAGLALGLVLPAALGPGIDLSAYAGDVPVGAYDLDPVLPAVLAAGLAAVAVLGAYAHTAINRRSLGTVLRVGDLA
jgi:putative ABC transport system permease protein